MSTPTTAEPLPDDELIALEPTLHLALVDPLSGSVAGLQPSIEPPEKTFASLAGETDILRRRRLFGAAVFLASKALAVPVGNILLAGDSPADVQAGRAAGARTAAVLWAAYKPERLREAGADFVCERVCDLVAAIETLHASGWPRHEGDDRGSCNSPG